MAVPNFFHDTDALSVEISELLVATADAADPAIDTVVPEVLQLLRQRLGMDVVFVSEFIDGRRVFRFVDRAPGAPALSAGDSNPLEESFCQRVVDGRLPELMADASARNDLPPVSIRVGAHLSTAIRLHDGRVYGTLCCFSCAPNAQLQQRDLTNLRHCAELVAHKIEAAQQQGRPVRWDSGRS